MKRRLALLLAVMMVLFLAACGGDKDPSPSVNEDNTPSSSGQQEQAGNNGDNGEDEPTKTGWWTEPYHLKLDKYISTDSTTKEIEVLYDGEKMLIWLASGSGEYAYMQDGKLWSATMQKDDPGSYSVAENKNHGTVLAYMERSAYPGGMLGDYEKFKNTPDMWKKQGNEAVAGIDCTVYSAEYNDGTVNIWVDESRGMVLKREAPDIYQDGKTALDYVVASFVTENVPTVSSVYQPPENAGQGGESTTGNADSKWPDNEFTQQVPKPDFPVSSAMTMGTIFTAVLQDVTADQLRAYAEQVKGAGFTIEPGGMDADGVFQYSAYNEAGYWVMIGSYQIEIQAPSN